VNSNEVDSSEANSDEEDNSKETDSDAGEDESEEPEMIQKQLVIYIGDQTSSSARYVKVNDSDQVYTIADDSLSAIIEKTVPDFWDLTVNSVSLNDLESLDIDAEDGKHTVNVSRETSEDEDGETIESVSYLVDDKTIEDTLFTTFYNKLVNMAGQSRLTEEYDPDEASVMKIVSHKTNGEVVETNFYEYDSSFYTAVVEDRIYLVNKMTVKELLTAYDDMIDSVGEISEESEAINNTDTDKIPDETPDGGDNTDEVITEDTSVAEEDINEDINTGEKSAEEDS
ncbi:MAG: DUF4340 domain-containing protein, partial [Eubacteriales bacterium]|nr:DUF4340 domain-containing protein [Eubacteriales bacterium]